ncbi:DUF6364 family protein [Acinetobacter sp.]
MQAKLTLSVNKKVIERAKLYALIHWLEQDAAYQYPVIS